ncbi:50S ribosomal protein L31 [bacterium]|nr:MAG: 50S ribosomal protein L31 [bacterium]
MKTAIHPNYNTAVKVTCSCGNSFTTGSTMESIETEICSNCHPFYTGKQKILDTTGNVDRFKKRVAAGAKAITEKKEKKPRKTRGSKAE